MNKSMPEHWDDVKLAEFLSGELERLPDDTTTVHVVPWMFQRMAEIVIGQTRVRSEKKGEG